VIGQRTDRPALSRSRSAQVFWIIVLNLIVVAAIRPNANANALPAFGAWVTVVIAIIMQAVPFLVLGVVLSGLIAAGSPGRLARILPQRTIAAVPVAGLAGVVLPGCECSSVPVARRLVAQGVQPAGALTFLLSAPAINPVVLVATAVAFPGQPRIVLARFVASLGAAIVVGLIWSRAGRDDLVAKARASQPIAVSRWANFSATFEHDFLHAGGFLVLGAMTAATLKVAVPRGTLASFAGHGVVSVLSLALLAVVLAVCSEADAFVAASLVQFSATAKLAFMVVGPMVDVKLIALQAGAFGRSFAARFAPLTFVVAVVAAVITARVLL
jgi:uncharacterized membrane protein YraQ (UPF0718 family)